jgi:hypothetical protein
MKKTANPTDGSEKLKIVEKQQLTDGKWNTKILNDNQSFPLWSFALTEVLLTEL